MDQLRDFDGALELMCSNIFSLFPFFIHSRTFHLLCPFDLFETILASCDIFSGSLVFLSLIFVRKCKKEKNLICFL